MKANKKVSINKKNRIEYLEKTLLETEQMVRAHVFYLTYFIYELFGEKEMVIPFETLNKIHKSELYVNCDPENQTAIFKVTFNKKEEQNA